MPDKHFYFSIGAGLGSGISYYVIRNKSKLQKEWRILRRLARKDVDWVLYFPLVIFIVGLWGLVPDIVHASGILSKEITRSGFFNIFFMHSFFEYIEDTNPTLNRLLNWLGQLIVFAVAIFTMIFYITFIKRINEPQRSGTDKLNHE